MLAIGAEVCQNDALTVQLTLKIKESHSPCIVLLSKRAGPQHDSRPSLGRRRGETRGAGILESLLPRRLHSHCSDHQSGAGDQADLPKVALRTMDGSARCTPLLGFCCVELRLAWTPPDQHLDPANPPNVVHVHLALDVSGSMVSAREQ